MGAQVELLDGAMLQRKDLAETGHVLPEEADQSELTQNTNDFGRGMLPHDDSVNASTKDLDRLDEGVCIMEKGGGFLATKKVLNIGEGRGLVLAGSLQDIFDLGGVCGGRVGEVCD